MKCYVKVCERPAVRSGWCNAHYYRNRRGQDMNTPIRGNKAQGKCGVKACDRPAVHVGWCESHYSRYRQGRRMDTPIRAPALKHIKDPHERRRQSAADRRLLVLQAYGGVCVCCGETEPKFLAIDHIDGLNGQKRVSGAPLYRVLKNLGFPTGYRVLCHNCNLAAGFYGQCPHPNGVVTPRRKRT